MTQFLRRNWNKYKRLGLRNKKKLTWRRPRGKHSKMRKRRKGYPPRVDAGYRTPLKNRGKIQGFLPILVSNIEDLSRITRDQGIIIAHVGKRKREDILKKAEEMKLKILNKERVK